MGQTQSIPQPTAGPVKRKKRQDPVRSTTKKKEDSFPIPDQWDDNAQFKVVSPASDISNPSQFRGRQHYLNNSNVNSNNHHNLPTSSVRRSRTSKVCPKQAPPKHTHLIQPANFYFGQNDNASEPSDEIDESHDTTEQIAPLSRPKRGAVELWKAKCARAKQHFMECFQQPQENSLKQRHFSQRANFQRVHSKDTTAPDGQEQVEVAQRESSKAYLQLSNMGDFKPVWKEQKYDSDPILQSHSEEAYIKRLSSLASSDFPPSSDPTSPSKLLIPEEPNTALQAPDKFPSICDSEQCDESYSPVEGRALSLHSGSLNRQSIRSLTTKSSSSTSEAGSATIIQERPPVFRNINCVEKLEEELGNVAISKRAHLCLNPSSENDLSSDKQYIQDAIQRQIDSKVQRTAVVSDGQIPIIEETKGISRVQRLRMQYQQEIERKANKVRNVEIHEERSRVQSAQVHVTTSKTPSFATEPLANKHVAKANTLAGNIILEKNGDSATGYKTRTVDANSTKSRSVSVPGRVSASYAYTSTNNVTKASRSSMSNVSLNGRRSISAPKSRPSLDGPALLHLAGWNQPWKLGDKKIPALLQVAGWNEKTKNFTKRHSLPVKTVPLTYPSEQAHLKNRLSLPSTNLQSIKLSENLHVENRQQREDTNVLREIKIAQDARTSKVMPSKGLSVNSRNEILSRPHIRQPISSKALNNVEDKGKELVSRACLDDCKNVNTVQVDEIAQKSALSLVRSHYRQAAIKPRGRPLALMLQQAYFQSVDEPAKAVGSPRSSSSLALIEASPAPSVDTTSSASTIPMLSDQVLSNAGFLFSEPSVLRVAKPSHDGLSITTLDSRNRISAFSGKPVDIPARSLEALTVKEHHDDDDGSYRRVRFSEESHEIIIPKNVSTFPIETKLSDVTESTTYRRESQSTNSTSLSIPRIDSIPEEDDEEEEKIETRNTSNLSRDYKEHSTEELKHGEKLSNISSEEDEAIFEDSCHDESPEKTPAVMRWSYRADNGLMKGVTPLLGGKTTCHTTNSPYLRFKEAKNRFSALTMTSKSSASYPKKVSPVKRSSPVKRTSGSLVTARIAAMEGKSNSGRPETSKPLEVCSIKVRRATTGKDVLAPRHSKLISPLFKKLHHIEKNDFAPFLESKNEDLEIHQTSAMFPGDEDMNNTSPSKDSESNLDDEDPFGVILHPTTLDEESCQTSADCDDFDALLNRESDDETVESSVQPSVSTVLQHQPYRFGGARRVSQATNVSSQPGGLSSDNVSVFSSTSSMGDTCSVPTVLQRRSSVFSRDENSLPSTVGGRIKIGTLPFRDAAPVKPNEQVHRTFPGSSCLSSMQKTPLEARTWRALAAAAQGKEKHRIHTTTNGYSRRSSLSECDPNTLVR